MKNTTSGSEFYVVVADAHLNGGDAAGAFSRLLARISELPRSCGAVFLGDIFDLWLALPGYESEEQKQFLTWCRTEKERREIFFIEGNHEFYLTQTRKDCFTAVSDSAIRCGGTLFLHGDRINRRDWKYFLLRTSIRNLAVRTLLRLAAPGGFGPGLCWKIRHGLHGTNLSNKKFFPERDAAALLSEVSKQEITHVLSGHFHRRLSLTEGACRLEVLPAYCAGEEIGFFNRSTGELKVGTTTDILRFRRETETT